MTSKITIDISTEEHYQKYTFYLEGDEIVDVYFSGKSKQGTSGFAEFIDVKHVPEYVMKAFQIQMEGCP